MIKFVVLLLAAAAAVATTCSSVEAVSSFEENHVGYDLHNDHFYFQDDYVSAAYKREKYKDTKIVLAGQKPGITGQEVPAAAFPFVVAQKALHVFGVTSDRWDVKVNDGGNQFMALYHSNGLNDFVANKLRAHLLRRVGNAIKDFLPSLDKTSEDHLPGEEYKDFVHEELKQMIKTTFKDLDDTIRNSMKDNDDNSAEATVVIITKSFIVVASIGAGRVVAYDSTQQQIDLTADKPESVNGDGFGKRKSKAIASEPFVKIYPRFFDDEGEQGEVHFLLMETGPTSEALARVEVTEIVKDEIKQQRLSGNEQEIFANSVTRLMKIVAGELGPIKKVQKPDHSVILVGLNRDYKNIH